MDKEDRVDREDGEGKVDGVDGEGGKTETPAVAAGAFIFINQLINQNSLKTIA